MALTYWECFLLRRVGIQFDVFPEDYPFILIPLLKMALFLAIFITPTHLWTSVPFVCLDQYCVINQSWLYNMLYSP